MGPTGAAGGAEDRSDAAVLRTLAVLSAGIRSGRPVEETLQDLADAVVEQTGFGVAALKVVQEDGDLRMLAVAGPDDAKAELVGKVTRRVTVDHLLSQAVRWGELRYLPHEKQLEGDYVWTPSFTPSDAPDAWHPEDGLVAPLYGPGGDLIGLLSVDLPPGLRKPSCRLRDLLELFAIQAGIAIDNARLVAELRRERDRLAASERAYRFLFTESAGAMATVSLGEADAGTIIQANDAFGRLIGCEPDGLRGRAWRSLVAGRDRSADGTGACADEVDVDGLGSGDREMVRCDGTPFWASVRGTIVGQAGQGPAVFLLHVDDITDRKHREAELVQLANADALTGLPNRRAFLAHLEAAVSRGSAAAVIYADLNRFKAVNDDFGHAVGDMVLREAARRLTSEVRSADMVARLGGDEFALVVSGVDALGTDDLVARIRTAFDGPMAACPDGRSVTVSVGWVPTTGTGPPPASLVDLADLAMFADKATRRQEA